MKVLTVDLGATSCKVSVVTFDGSKLLTEEMGRFKVEHFRIPNDRGEDLFWDLPNAFSELEDLILTVEGVKSISVDSWGVDFGLLDSNGRLVSLPHHYRDDRTEGVMDRFFEKMERRKIYEITGTQFMRINTIYQLYSMVLENDPRLETAETLLMIADLVMYWLSGAKFVEYTLASTTQMLDARKGEWSDEIVEILGIDGLLPDVVDPGTIVGRMRKRGEVEVVAGTSHDTAAAVLAIPFEGDGIFMSSGTWSLIGVELDSPFISDESYELDFANEGLFGRKIKFLKNTTGMWILEECNSEWGWEYRALIDGAKEVDFEAFYDPDDPVFIPPGNMANRLRKHLEERRQRIPGSVPEMARVIFENAVFNYAWVVEKIENMLGREYETIHVVGGASRNELINQLLANVTGKVVKVGPVEATTVGNALAQLIALGVLGGVEEAREIVSRSFEVSVFEPRDVEMWKDKFSKWKETVGKF